MDRDNVTPAYLRELRTIVYNQTFNLIKEEEVVETWVTEATSHPDCTPEAVVDYVEKKVGKKAVIFDPSDKEANYKAVSKGCGVIKPRSITKEQWVNVKTKAPEVKPAGQVYPTSKPYSDNPDATLETVIPEDEWTEGMQKVVRYAKMLAKNIVHRDIRVRLNRGSRKGRAAYGEGSLVFFFTVLGNKWFDSFPNNMEEVTDLLIHEFGHEYSGNHLSDEYYRALTKLAGRSVMLALRYPEFFPQPESKDRYQLTEA